MVNACQATPAGGEPVEIRARSRERLARRRGASIDGRGLSRRGRRAAVLAVRDRQARRPRARPGRSRRTSRWRTAAASRRTPTRRDRARPSRCGCRRRVVKAHAPRRRRRAADPHLARARAGGARARGRVGRLASRRRRRRSARTRFDLRRPRPQAAATAAASTCCGASRAESPETKVVVITAHGTRRDRGRGDEARRLRLRQEAVRARRAAHHRRRTRCAPARSSAGVAYHDGRERSRFDADVDARPLAGAWCELEREVAMVAPQPVPVVLVVGETGSGKALVARRLHYGVARARRRPVRRAQRGGHPRDAGRVRAVRPRARRLLRRARAQARPGRGGRRRHAVPRRDGRSRRRGRRPSCSPSSSRSPSAASAPPPRAPSTCAWWRRPTATSPRWSRRAASAPTSTIGWPRSRCGCRRCASGARTSAPLAAHFVASYAQRYRQALPRASATRRRRVLAALAAGRATCAS